MWLEEWHLDVGDQEIEYSGATQQRDWVDAQGVIRSVVGFAELQGMGSLLEHLPTFSEQVASALRVDLGDWRDTVTWPDKIFTDLAARYEFYVGRGFDPALTHLPAAAFRESAEIAGFRRKPPPIVDAYGSPVPRSHNEDDEAALVRTNEAQDWLLRLETQIRKFLDQQMTSAFGADWPKHRLPKDLYDQWQEKKRDAEKSGARSRPLVAYADFTDYERVICKKDNWREVFGVHFGRPESVREAFQRLYPKVGYRARATDHARG